MSNPVLVDDVAVRWRPISTDERPAVQAMLDDAWAVAKTQIPTLAANLDTNAVSYDLVKAVLSAMVIRVLRNPNGVKQWSVDDYSETRDGAVSAGSLYLSDAEIDLLTSASGHRHRGAFSVAPAREHSRSRGAEWQFEQYGHRW